MALYDRERHLECSLMSVINGHQINRISRRLFEKVWRMIEWQLEAVVDSQAGPETGAEVKIVSLSFQSVQAELAQFYCPSFSLLCLQLSGPL